MAATHTAANALKRQNLSGRFWWLSMGTLLAAVVMNTLIVLTAHMLFTVAPTFVPLQLASVIPATLVAVTSALIVFALINRRAARPTRLFRRIAGGVLLLSIVPDLLLPIIGLYPGTTLPEVGALLLIHLATALLCVSMAPRLVDARA